METANLKMAKRACSNVLRPDSLICASGTAHTAIAPLQAIMWAACLCVIPRDVSLHYSSHVHRTKHNTRYFIVAIESYPSTFCFLVWFHLPQVLANSSLNVVRIQMQTSPSPSLCANTSPN